MRILPWSINFYDYELILFGDNQEGNVLQYRKGYRQAIEYILESKNRFAIHMGDEQEAFWIDDKRYDPVTMESTPLKQQANVIKDLAPLAKNKRLITILYGNHSHRLYPKIGDITENTCERLNVLYGGFACVVQFIDKHGPQYKGYFTHGRKLIRSVADDPTRRLANEKLQVKQHLKNKMGDCLLMAKGHTHRLIVVEPQPQLYLGTDKKDGRDNIAQHYTHNPPFGKGGYVHPDHRWYANTGSFLKCYGEDVNSYSEVGEYDPTELGYVVVEVHDRTITNVRKVVV
ncbi:MAG: hypothetical protein EHM49_08270 [Deltaproteobacteria bacterium]|nr:MAG: hypothetical protein EHM49_08270 [Deltaproteobacteria bacterium]